MKKIEDYPGGEDLITINRQIKKLYSLKRTFFNNFLTLNKGEVPVVLFKLLVKVAPLLTISWYKHTFKTDYPTALQALKHIKNDDDV